MDVNIILEELGEVDMGIFVSMPMNGKTNEEILNKIEEIKHKFPEDIVTSGFIDGAYTPKVNHVSVHMLGYAIQEMSYCDVVYFAQGWQTARGCQIEHNVCMEYDIPMMFEDDDDD